MMVSFHTYKKLAVCAGACLLPAFGHAEEPEVMLTPARRAVTRDVAAEQWPSAHAHGAPRPAHSRGIWPGLAADTRTAKRPLAESARTERAERTERTAETEKARQEQQLVDLTPVPSVQVRVNDLDKGGINWLEAVRAAVRTQPAIVSAMAAVGRSQGLLDMAEAGYYPRLQFGLSMGNSDALQSEGPFAKERRAGLSASQMLFDFGKVRSATNEAKAGQRRQQAELHKAIDDVISQTVQTLVEVSRYQELERITRDQILALSDVHRITELRADAGASTRTDSTRASSRVDAARAALVSVRSFLQQSRIKLEKLVGAPLNGRVGPAPEALLQRGLAIHEVDPRELPAVQLAMADREIAQSQLEGSRAQRYPTVSLDASVSRAGGPNAAYMKNPTTGSVQISLSSTLYQGGALEAQVRASLRTQEMAEANIDRSRMDAQESIRVLKRQAQGLLERMPVLERRALVINQTRALYREQYLSLGTRNALDLLDAEQEIAQAAQDLANARHDLWAAQLGYIVANGQGRALFGVASDEQ